MEISSFNEEYENKENINIICFDPDNETEDVRIRLRQINNHIVFHTKLESCITFFESTEKEKIFLVTSDSSVSQMLPHIDIFHQVDCIFIFRLKRDDYKYLYHEDLET
jgi:hypothetical protein